MALGGQFLEDLRPRGISPGLGLLAAVQAHFVEQDFAQLLGRSDVEFVAGKLMNLALQIVHAGGEIGAQVPQDGGVDLDAAPFHVAQHRDQGPFQGLINGDHVFGHQARLEHAMQTQRDIRVLGGVIQGLIQRHPVERHLGLAGPGDVLELDGVVIKEIAGQVVHAVAVQAAVEHVGQ